MLAGKGLNAKRGSAVDAPQNALPNPALDGSQTSQGTNGATDGDPSQAAPFASGMSGNGRVRAPSIANLTPSEIAEKLFNKIMLLNTQGKSDSVQFFAPMAIQAYQMLEQQQGHAFDADQRYDVGRIGEVAGAVPLAKAQADTILREQPDHLLGLILAAHVAKLSGNTSALREYTQHFARVKRAELAKTLPEYRTHQTDIDSGI